MRSLWVAVLAMAAACGQVNKAVDAGQDAYQPDSGSPTCLEGEMLCNNTCANVMTSELYCGNCTTRCNELQACENGACMPADSCSRVRDANPNAGDGLYSSPSNNVFYCDFAAKKQYEFGIGQYNAPPNGFVVMRASDFADPGVQKGFIAMYNAIGGMKALHSWSSSSSCCFSTTGGLEMYFGGVQTYPAAAGALVCTSWTADTIYQFCRGTSTTGIATAPLVSNFFVTNAPTEVALCTDATNPGYLMKVGSF